MQVHVTGGAHGVRPWHAPPVGKHAGAAGVGTHGEAQLTSAVGVVGAHGSHGAAQHAGAAGVGAHGAHGAGGAATSGGLHGVRRTLVAGGEEGAQGVIVASPQVGNAVVQRCALWCMYFRSWLQEHEKVSCVSSQMTLAQSLCTLVTWYVWPL